MEHRLDLRLLNKQVRVVVVGAGGTGSQVVAGLAQLHFAMVSLGHQHGLHVTIVDDDLVSEANIGRQMFYPSDVGQPKATVLVNRVNLTMGLTWEAKVGRLGSDSRLNADIVIGCVDNRKARKSIMQALQNSGGGYWLDFGNRQHDGQVILGEVGASWGPKRKERLPHVGDLFPELVDPTLDAGDDIPSCSLAEALEKQSLFVNRSVAVWGLNMLWELFRRGKLDYHGVFVNLQSGRASSLPVSPEAWARFSYPPKRTRKRKAKV